MFWNFSMHVLVFIEEVTSKFFIWLYHLCVLSLLEFRVLHYAKLEQEEEDENEHKKECI